MEKKERNIAIRYDKTDIAKVIMSEDLYKTIEENLQKIKDDEIKEDYVYSSYVFGDYEERFHTYFDKSEKFGLRKKYNLYTMSNDDYNTMSEHVWSGDYCLANVIYHTSKNTTAEDNYKDYISYFNFYNGKMRIFSVVVTEGDNSKPKIDFFEQVNLHREVYRRDKVFIRVNDMDIPIEKYQTMHNEDTTNYGAR